MNRDDAMRKVRLLKQVRPENGATEPEADNAQRLAKRLIDQHVLETSDWTSFKGKSETRRSWVYWEHIADEHRVTLSHFGTRGSIRLDDGKMLVLIELGSGEWQVQRASRAGYETVRRGRGLESFRDYMQLNAPRAYTFAR
jgi:hypothetical protein